MYNSREKIRNHFKKELTTFEKEHNIKIGSSTITKLTDNYTMTLLLEKDIEPLEWIEENITDILNIYSEDITILKREQ